MLTDPSKRDRIRAYLLRNPGASGRDVALALAGLYADVGTVWVELSRMKREGDLVRLFTYDGVDGRRRVRHGWYPNWPLIARGPGRRTVSPGRGSTRGVG